MVLERQQFWRHFYLVLEKLIPVSYTHLDVYKRQVEIVGLKEEIQKAVVTGVEMFRKQLDEGIAGDNVGVCLLYTSSKKK